MNYRHVYMRIIVHAKLEMKEGKRPLNYQDKKNFPDQYFEFHHIFPRSLFPEYKNFKQNLVALTLKEHYFCHKLLTQIWPTKEMFSALWMLSLTRDKIKIKNSKEYENLKKIHVQKMSKIMKDHPEIYGKARWKKNHKTWNRGLTLNDEYKKRISEGTKKAMKNIDMKTIRNKVTQGLSEDEILLYNKRYTPKNPACGNRNSMSNPIHREKVSLKRKEASILYKNYKASGGNLMWNEWNKQRRLGLI